MAACGCSGEVGATTWTSSSQNDDHEEGAAFACSTVYCECGSGGALIGCGGTSNVSTRFQEVRLHTRVGADDMIHVADEAVVLVSVDTDVAVGFRLAGCQAGGEAGR